MNSLHRRLSVAGQILTVGVLALLTLSSPAGAQVSNHSKTVIVQGIWKTSGYQCPAGVRHTEKIRVVQHNKSVVATKITGDRCVPAGHVTFEGTLNGTSAVVNLYTGYPGERPTLQRNCTVLKIVNSTTIELTGACFAEGNLVFRKVS